MHYVRVCQKLSDKIARLAAVLENHGHNIDGIRKNIRTININLVEPENEKSSTDAH